LPVFHELADERTAAIGKPLEINPFILAKLKLLTAQERKIAEELSIGRNFREIGRSHNMNESQVREIKSVILQKTGVFTRSHLADLFAAELQQQVHETLTASR
jgi:DNA-binding CsgD family transcriptional regulator